MFLPLALKLAAIAASVLGISFIIIFHEFGHFVFCKIFKVYAPTFSIGMGKVLWSKKIGSTDFCLSAAPIGGYVEVASDQAPEGFKAFNHIPYWQKVCIMLGGITFNFILAYVCLTLLFISGMPQNAQGPYEPATTKVTELHAASLNQEQLQAGDTFITLNNKTLTSDLKDARAIIKEAYEQKLTSIPATVMRNNEPVNLDLHLAGKQQTPNITSQIGCDFEIKPRLNLCNALSMAYKTTIFYTVTIIDGLKSMVSNKNAKGFVGPLMAVAASSKSAQKGLKSLILFLAIISINLGFMNLLPLPIFDGGQFVIFTTEAILRRQISEKARNIIATSSWVLAIGLLILFTIKDVFTLILG